MAVRCGSCDHSLNRELDYGERERVEDRQGPPCWSALAVHGANNGQTIKVFLVRCFDFAPSLLLPQKNPPPSLTMEAPNVTQETYSPRKWYVSFFPFFFYVFLSGSRRGTKKVPGWSPAGSVSRKGGMRLH